MRVATDVVEDLLRAGPGPLGVDDPFGLPQSGERASRLADPGVGPAILEAEGLGVVRGLEVLQEEATEQARAPARARRIPATGHPPRAVGRETAAGSHSADADARGVSAPGVEPGELGTEMPGIGGDRA